MVKKLTWSQNGLMHAAKQDYRNINIVIRRPACYYKAKFTIDLKMFLDHAHNKR